MVFILKMKREMEVEEIDAVLQKMWDLHDKISDAIHSISRAHFLHSINSSLRPTSDKTKFCFRDYGGTGNRTGFVFVKGFPVDGSALQEAKSLNAIRTALENLEDQLELFNTVQTQQQAERDAAIARLEQSRIVLALRLGDQGKNYKVIEEVRAFVGDVRDASRFASLENLYGSAASPFDKKFVPQDGKVSNVLFKILMSGLHFAKKSVKLDHLNGILGNAAMVAVSMIAVLHLHQLSSKVSCNLNLRKRREDNDHGRNVRKVSQLGGLSPSDRSAHIDVLLARG